jgi:hypothetical protein
MQTASNHMGQDLESREDVPISPRPSMAPAVAHHSGDEMLHCPLENETMPKQFSLVMTKSWPQHILQGHAVILAILIGMGWSSASPFC